jgi:hypothetical protein
MNISGSPGRLMTTHQFESSGADLICSSMLPV